jgi:uncharacterized protein YwqG
LSFVAQIDFAEIHTFQALDGFPSIGRLLLFCDAHVWPWGQREHQRRAHVSFIEADTVLDRRSAPEEFGRPEAKELRSEGFVFNPRRLRPTAWLLPPSFGSHELLRLQDEAPGAWRPDGPAFIAYEQFWTDLVARPTQAVGDASDTVHQVGGTAFSIQRPVEAECARFSGVGDDWRLVLQIDSDPVAGMQWGDNGRIYVCARCEDLIGRHFDRCWTLMQCY